jgi:hypothetical protein
MSIKNETPLVKAVLALDEHFAELDRLGAKINSLEMKSEFDFEHAERLMARFAECGQGVSDEVTALAQHLNDARARAEAMAAGVAERAALVKARKSNEQEKYEEYRQLGEKVRELSFAMAELKPEPGAEVNDETRAKMSARLAAFEDQLNPLIVRAQNLRNDARNSKIKLLEQNADSLTQTLQAIQQKLGTLNLPQQ